MFAYFLMNVSSSFVHPLANLRTNSFTLSPVKPETCIMWWNASTSDFLEGWLATFILEPGSTLLPMTAETKVDKTSYFRPVAVGAESIRNSYFISRKLVDWIDENDNPLGICNDLGKRVRGHGRTHACMHARTHTDWGPICIGGLMDYVMLTKCIDGLYWMGYSYWLLLYEGSAL